MYLMPTYRTFDVSFTHGRGSWLFSSDEKYLDFTAGIGVTGLGHNHPAVVQALKAQAERYWHCTNMYRIPEAERLAEKICEMSFGERVFFANSGTEAVETGLKLIRRYQWKKNRPERTKVISIGNAFHGRSIAEVALTGRSVLFEGFVAGECSGYDNILMNDMRSLGRLEKDDVAGIVLELVQGEGGLGGVSGDFLHAVADICRERDIVLMFDEVQTGIGRTGRLFAYQHYGIEPDVMAIAKGMGNGFPIGACVAKAQFGDCLDQGSHGSTFGGNPLACAVAMSVIERVSGTEMEQQVTARAKQLREGLVRLKDMYPAMISEVKGLGLLLGLRVSDRDEFVEACLQRNLLVGKSGPDVVKLSPPLIVTQSDISVALDVLAEVCESRAGGLAV